MTIYVDGQQWTWTFNYMPGGDISTADDQVLCTVGEQAPPTLCRPVNRTVEFSSIAGRDPRLRCTRVLEKMDVIRVRRRTTNTSR